MRPSPPSQPSSPEAGGRTVCLLAGGTGGALLAVGLDRLLAPGDLTVITNTGDDFERWGLHVSPDTDSILYRLAGIFNQDAGWGVEGETFAALQMLGRYGEETWFQIGDRDLATHVLRTHLLRQGLTLTETTIELCRRLGLRSRLLPMSDDAVRTHLETDRGPIPFQDYFVRERCQPRVDGVRLEGLERARPSEPAALALGEADLVVIGPSNPLVSVGPILAVLGHAIPPQRTMVVSPIIGGRALKGPTAEMMRSTGREPSSEGIAREYQGRARWFMLDEADAAAAEAIGRLGYEPIVADTVMAGPEGSGRLAAAILAAVEHA